MDYEDFLKSKGKDYASAGFDPGPINTALFDFQQHIVKTALEKGRYAIFADCGLGKTLMQLEWADKVSRYTEKPVLILAPLAVTGQTKQEANRFGYSLDAIDVYNYEQLDNIDCDIYSGVVLDESSILKNFTGKMKQRLDEAFRNTPYKLCCTATPSPNDPMEMGNHSEFLGVMSRNEMLAMYFVHDGGNTSKWRLKKHAHSHFYRFISEWAVMLSKPHDIGFCATGYNLPDLNISEQVIETENQGNGQLFNDTAVSATDFNKELRRTMQQRCEKVADIVAQTPGQIIIWIKQNAEGELLRKMIPEAVEVKGSDNPELKESRLLGFADNEFRIMITKAKIAQFGLNYQNCSTQIFCSFDFSFEGLYQAIRRSYRFGQKKDVQIVLITTDTMMNVLENIKRKQKDFEIMQKEMSKAINEESVKRKAESVQYESDVNPSYELHRGDCVNLIKDIESESVGFSIFSPPFAELYTYSSHIEDMGNSKDYKEFLTQFGFLTKELSRVIKQGRNVAVHCMDLPIQKGKEGFIGLRDFSGLIRTAFEDAGFIYHSRVTIWKDPVIEMQRTKALGLLHKQLKKDSTMSRTGIPDYLMVFRKDGDRTDPVKSDIPVELWQKYASPVWMDINYSDTLQYRSARDKNDEKHICPLQLPTIERAIHLYTNPGDTVYSPFAGIGSEVYQAVKMGRYGIGHELKHSYYEQAKKNVISAVAEKNQKSLFQ